MLATNVEQTTLVGQRLPKRRFVTLQWRRERMMRRRQRDFACLRLAL